MRAQGVSKGRSKSVAWWTIATTLVAGALAGCAMEEPEPDTGIRVVHLSPDAPRIDVFVDDEGPVVDSFAFTEASSTFAVLPGNHSLSISAAGRGIEDAVISLDRLNVTDGERITAFAFGPLSDLSAGSIEDSTDGLSTGNVRLRIVHTGYGVGAVDVYAVGDDGGLDRLVDGLRYGNASDPIDVPPEPFTAGIDVDGDGAPDLSYSVPALPAGQVVNVFATVDSDGAVFLLAQLPGGATARLDAASQRLRVLHLSPDAPAVIPVLEGDALSEAIEFGESTTYVGVSAAMGQLDVTTDGTTGTSVLSAPLRFTDGRSYTAVALGRVSDLRALFFEDDREGLGAGDIRVRAIHGAPDVGEVDVYTVARDGRLAPLVENVVFGDVSDPLDVPSGAYTLGVDVDDDRNADLYFELPELSAGTLANVFVTEDASGAVFALAQLEGSATAQFQPSEAEVRVLHLSRDAPNVDVYAGSALAVENLAFEHQSATLTVPAGPLQTAVTATGARIDTAVIDATLQLLPGRSYTVVAYDDLARIKAAVLLDDAEGLDTSNIRVPITHVAPDVTRGDVYVLLNDATTFGARLVDDFGFGETPPPIDVPAGTYTIGFDAEANGDVQAIFDLPLLTPGTYARAYVYQRADASVAALVQLRDSIVIAPAR